jgi:hypothetical protein
MGRSEAAPFPNQCHHLYNWWLWWVSLHSTHTHQLKEILVVSLLLYISWQPGRVGKWFIVAHLNNHKLILT